MSERVVCTSDRKPEIARLLRLLPAMLSGRVQDEHGIAAGFRARLGMAFYSLVAPNFEKLGRGQAGADGDVWPPLSAEYLAYSRPITGRKPPKAGKKAPGGKDGLLTGEQLKLWNREFAHALNHYIVFESEEEAKSHAAAIAWLSVERAGGKTKLSDPRFGGRQAGIDYQILVSEGYLANSLKPGQLIEKQGPDAEYRGSQDQHFEDESYRLIVGSDDHKAKYHHNGHGTRKRRLWPERFPSDWWQQILGTAASGLTRIGQLFGGGAI